MSEWIDTVEPVDLAIKLRAPAGEGQVTLLCLEVMGLQYPSVAFRVELRKDAFTGSNPRIWVDAPSLFGFMSQLEQLDRMRSGEAALSAMSPGEFELRLRTVDGAGHLLVTSSVSRIRRVGGASTLAADTTTVHFEVEPWVIREVLDGLQQIANLLAAASGPGD